MATSPSILQWNLARFAETLLPLIDADEGRAIERATSVLQGVATRFDRHWLDGFRRKLGLSVVDEGDHALVTDLLAIMHAEVGRFHQHVSHAGQRQLPTTTRCPPRLPSGWAVGARGWHASPAASRLA